MESIKAFIFDQLGLPSWLALALIGLLTFGLLNAALRKPISSKWGLLAPFLIGLAVEGIEIWGHYRPIGLFAVGNDPVVVIFARHATDVLKMMALPLLAVGVAAVRARAESQDENDS